MSMARKLVSVILAAGRGSRMRSSLAKVLHPMAGRSLIDHISATARSAGSEAQVIVIGHQGEEVKAHILASQENCIFAWQKDPKGTGHAMLQALDKIPADATDVLIMAGDCPLVSPERLQGMWDYHQKAKVDLTLGITQMDNPFGYGRVIAKGKTIRIVEEKDASASERKVKVVNGGLYLVNLKYLQTYLKKIKPSKVTGEFYLTDILALGSKDKKKLTTFLFPSQDLMGVNDFSQLSQVELIYRDRLIQSWMEKGVRFLLPHSVVIEADVQLAQGVVVGPQVSLLGKTKVGTDSKIEAGCVLKNSEVGENVNLKAYSHLENAKVENHCEVGPFARLRPEALLKSKAKVGNFVEIKKSTIGEGSKVNHLSYVGDATIGKEVNVGCGFITCNYDGVNKHQTILEDHSFIGSGVQAVAPIVVGKEAYIASGSTINRNVPAGALGIGRSKQENKEGYAEILKNRMKAKKKDH